MHGYLMYKYEWINVVNLPHAKTFIKEFEARKVSKFKAVTKAKAKGKRLQNTSRARMSILIDDNDNVVDDGNTTRHNHESK